MKFTMTNIEASITGKLVLNVPRNSFPMYSLTFSCSDLPLVASGLFGTSDPFIRILKKNPGFGNQVFVCETEVIRGESNPCFKPLRMSAQRLCSSKSGITQMILIENLSVKSGTTQREAVTA